ncbi:hypothetical protein ACFL6P_08240, partial [Candidatus Latescibacterota bacterium]
MPKPRPKEVENPLMQAQVEISNLKLTIMAQRDAMDSQKIDAETHLQEVVAGINDEVVQLKAAINALRDELEHSKIKHEDNVQAIEKASHDEIKQLKEMIDALRSQL